MNIFPSFPNPPIFFREILLPTLSIQQKRILAVASFALAFLAACYFISRGCFTAKVINGEQAQEIDDEPEQLEKDLTTPPPIQEVDLSHMSGPHDLGKAIQELPKGIKSVNLSYNTIFYETKLLPQDLEEINLSNCGELIDVAIIDLPRGIKKLNLCNCSLRAVSFQHFTFLEELDLSHCDQLTHDDIAHLPEGMKKLKLSGWNQLKSLSILQHLEKLEELDLSHCLPITDAQIAYLPKGIKKLNLSGCEQLCNASFQHLEGLEELDLSFCFFTKDLIQNLPKGIKLLKLRNCKTIIDESFTSLLKNIHVVY